MDPSTALALTGMAAQQFAPNAQAMLRHAARMGLDAAQKRIGEWATKTWRARKKRRTVKARRPVMLSQSSCATNYGTTQLTVNSLNAVSLTALIGQGSKAGDRRLNKIFFKGVRMNHVIRNNDDETPMVYHIAVCSPKYVNIGTAVDYNTLFFSNPSSGDNGRDATDFNAAGLSNTIKNLLPINSTSYTTHFHKRWVVNKTDEIPVAKTTLSRSISVSGSAMLPTTAVIDTDTAYIKIWVGVNKWVTYDYGAGDATNPVIAFTWCEPYRFNKAGSNMDREVEYNVYFKNQ